MNDRSSAYAIYKELKDRTAIPRQIHLDSFVDHMPRIQAENTFLQALAEVSILLYEDGSTIVNEETPETIDQI